MHRSYAGWVETGSQEGRVHNPEIVAESPLSAETHVLSESEALCASISHWKAAEKCLRQSLSTEAGRPVSSGIAPRRAARLPNWADLILTLPQGVQAYSITCF